jgi:hypothetical protein
MMLSFTVMFTIRNSFSVHLYRHSELLPCRNHPAMESPHPLPNFELARTVSSEIVPNDVINFLNPAFFSSALSNGIFYR